MEARGPEQHTSLCPFSLLCSMYCLRPLHPGSVLSLTNRALPRHWDLGRGTPGTLTGLSRQEGQGPTSLSS